MIGAKLSSCKIAVHKVTDYLLDPAKSKAGFFSRFGFTLADPMGCATAMLDHPRNNPVAATEATAYGTKHMVKCHLVTPDGRDPCIVTVWMDRGDGEPEFVTAYPGK